MRCLGPAIIDSKQQREVERGGEIVLANKSSVIFEDAAERAIVGDSFWIKERWWLVEPHRYEGPRFGQRKIPGSTRFRLAVPDDLRAWWHIVRMTICHPDSVRHLQRSDSRAYLAITEILEGGFRCSSHMQNIDAYLNSLGARAA